MSNKFFKKYKPSQSVYFSDGGGFRGFEVVDHDWGILATEDARIIRELQACIAGQRGGVEEITGEEYLELQSKKKGTLPPLWREEWQPRKHPVRSPEVLAQAPAGRAVDEQKPVAAPAGDAPFRPTTSKQT